MKYLAIPAMLLLLTACEHGPNEFSIQITNLTHDQPLSPPAAMLHGKDLKTWTLGVPASEAIEHLAEGGDASGLLALQRNAPKFAADAPLFPGEFISFTLKTRNPFHKHLTLAGMLVNTNDAFTGINAMELDDLEAGQTRVVYTYALDAGTEFNSELAGTIPGPADGGEGFNAARDDVTPLVTYHGGVVSRDDSHHNSVLTQSHRFDGPVLRVEITAM